MFGRASPPAVKSPPAIFTTVRGTRAGVNHGLVVLRWEAAACRRGLGGTPRGPFDRAFWRDGEVGRDRDAASLGRIYSARVDLVDIEQLPIPDWGLTCPRCGYALRGLTRHRCPECGSALFMREIIQPWTRLRGPMFTGYELPIPDFNLTCMQCGRSAAGWSSRACPQCGTAFDPAAYLPESKWFRVDAEIRGVLLEPVAEVLLAERQIPHFTRGDRTLPGIILGQVGEAAQLMSPSEFYFEVRFVLWSENRRILSEAGGPDQREWTCGDCGESSPATFDLCWNCQTPRDG